MTTLALEFSSTRRSAALLTHGLVVAEAVHSELGHTPAMALTRRVLEQAGLGLDSISRIVVGLGPGSYAGIRLALAFAQGWSLKGGVDLAGVSSLEALIRGIPGDGAQEGMTGLVLMDAQRGEYHALAVEFSQNAWSPQGNLTLMTKECAERARDEGTRIFGPEVRRSFGGGTDCFPTACQVGILGWAMMPVVAPEVIEPIYLRAAAFVKAPQARRDIADGLLG